MAFDSCGNFIASIVKNTVASELCTYLKTVGDRKVNSTLMQSVDCRDLTCDQSLLSHDASFASIANCAVLDVATGTNVEMSKFSSLCGNVRASLTPTTFTPSSSHSAAATTSSTPSYVAPGATASPAATTIYNTSSSSTVTIVIVVAAAVVMILLGAMFWQRCRQTTTIPSKQLDPQAFVMLDEPPPSTVDSNGTKQPSSPAVSTSLTLLADLRNVDMGALALFRVRRSDVTLIQSYHHRGAQYHIRRAEYLGQAVALTSCRDSHHIPSFVAEMKLLSTYDQNRVWWGTYTSDLTLVTEFMIGGTLREALARSSSTLFFSHTFQLSWQQKLTIARHIVDGLVYLHSLDTKVLHRDLTSHHVLLTVSSPSCSQSHQPSSVVAKLHGFHRSRPVQCDDLTLTAGVGTLVYAAPEVLQGGYYDDRADMFSLGVVLSELDTEEMPYYENLQMSCGGKPPLSNAALSVGIMTGSLEPTFSRDCPAWYVALARDCLQLDPHLRPSASKVAYRMRVQK
ncbi:hypothetical protein DYB31_013660 [Aphanomyces astaci]|uniref:Protein kinase domain-containing protein n=1 Tax=Aphanomyces astaci TaxID=112090 RepID=A0A397EXU8_APHAT|nr:hypothetical protein DYB31_013660 [Aphanomyces astaci]